MALPQLEINKVVVHPLVLLSVVDHFNRIRNQKRVVGVLLGAWRKGILDVSNSFAGLFCYKPFLFLKFQFNWFSYLKLMLIMMYILSCNNCRLSSFKHFILT